MSFRSLVLELRKSLHLFEIMLDGHAPMLQVDSVP